KRLDEASTTNLGEERSVGLLNYELSIRGKANFEAVSRKILLYKSFDLLRNKDNIDFKRFRKPAKEIKQSKLKWNSKMQEREKAGYNQKYILNSQIESMKYNDLEYLKTFGGPFTTPEEVDNFMESCSESKEKNKRLYIEVRYAKNSCVSLKHSASVFALRRNCKNLASDKYASNLKEYLGDTRHKTILTIEDLTGVLEKIRNLKATEHLTQDTVKNSEQSSLGNQDADNISHPCTSVQDANKLSHPCTCVGNHIAAFWIDDDGNERWYLGIVECVTANNLIVTYFRKLDGKHNEWVPTDEKLETEFNQVISWNVPVSYVCSERIRCIVPKQIADEIEKLTPRLASC
ncbi:unnamed protein product, partial [Meganyctiphanes norvegica]